MAKYKKKRARELQHDKFRDTTMSFFDRLGDALEGKGRTILYGIGGVLLAIIVVVAFVKWRHKKNDEAALALGRAITVAKAPIMATPMPGTNDLTFPSEVERAQKAIVEFEKVAAKYGDPYKTESLYFIASNRLVLDRQKGLSELTTLSNSNIAEVATLSKFALAQAKESDGQLDEAAKLYSDISKLNSTAVSPETANVRLAKVYEKQSKKKEAADILFNIVDASRKARDKDNQPVPTSAAAREAADELKKLDPDRYAQLPPETPPILAG